MHVSAQRHKHTQPRRDCTCTLSVALCMGVTLLAFALSTQVQEIHSMSPNHTCQSHCTAGNSFSGGVKQLLLAAVVQPPAGRHHTLLNGPDPGRLHSLPPKNPFPQNTHAGSIHMYSPHHSCPRQRKQHTLYLTAASLPGLQTHLPYTMWKKKLSDAKPLK